MRVGVSLSSSYMVDDVRDGAAQMVARAAAADDAGLDVLSIGDRHSVPLPYYQNTPMLGRLLAEWGERPAGCLFLVPLWHPVTMAEQIGTLASIARGPFVVQTGLGGGDEQFAAMGVSLRDRRRWFEEKVDLVKALLAGETVSSSTFGIEGAVANPTPPGTVEWWIGTNVDAGIDRAARMGDAWYADVGLTLETAAASLETYLAACDRHGRTPVRIPLRRDVYVAESQEDAETAAVPWVERNYRGLPPEAIVYGSVETVAEEFSRYGELGFTDIIVRQLPVEPDQAVASIMLLGEVRRRLQR